VFFSLPCLDQGRKIEVKDEVIAALGAAGVAVLTLVANTILAALARHREKQAVITAFRSDIRSIILLIDQHDLVGIYLSAFRKSFPSKEQTHWPDFAPQEENYFQLFDAMAGKIGMTPIGLAREIVRFYTFLRASRDTARLFKTLSTLQTTNGKHVEIAENVLRALAEMLQAADEVLASKHSPSNFNKGQKIAKKLYKRIDTELKHQAMTGRIIQRIARCDAQPTTAQDAEGRAPVSSLFR
jgi:hypothetical protein